jgi:acetoin utilization protein AcuB
MLNKTSPVSEYMTTHPHSIGRSQKLSTAHALMRRYAIRHLPVLEAGHVVGLVSLKDLHLFETLPDVEPTEVSVEEAMMTDPYTVSPSKPLGDVANDMATCRYDAAIVVEDAKVTGVFTTLDALRALRDALLSSK